MTREPKLFLHCLLLCSIIGQQSIVMVTSTDYLLQKPTKSGPMLSEGRNKKFVGRANMNSSSPILSSVALAISSSKFASPSDGDLESRSRKSENLFKWDTATSKAAWPFLAVSFNARTLSITCWISGRLFTLLTLVHLHTKSLHQSFGPLCFCKNCLKFGAICLLMC